MKGLQGQPTRLVQKPENSALLPPPHSYPLEIQSSYMYRQSGITRGVRKRRCILSCRRGLSASLLKTFWYFATLIEHAHALTSCSSLCET